MKKSVLPVLAGLLVPSLVLLILAFNSDSLNPWHWTGILVALVAAAMGLAGWQRNNRLLDEREQECQTLRQQEKSLAAPARLTGNYQLLLFITVKPVFEIVSCLCPGWER